MSDGTLTQEQENTRIATENARILGEWLSAVEQRASKSNEKWIVVSLLKSTLRAYSHLLNGWPNDSSQTAWACRNLLELRIFAKYVVRSQDDRKRFIYDWLIDMEQLTEAQKKLTTQVAPDLSLVENDELLENLRSKKQSLGIEANKYLRANELAKELGIEEEFNVMNKICSKLVHPTSLSILSIDLETDESTRGALVMMGRNYLSELMSDLIPLIITLAGMEQAAQSS